MRVFSIDFPVQALGSFKHGDGDEDDGDNDDDDALNDIPFVDYPCSFSSPSIEGLDPLNSRPPPTNPDIASNLASVTSVTPLGNLI